MAAEIPLLLRNRLPALLGWKSSYFGLIWHLLKAIVCVTFSLCCKQTHFHTHPTVLKNQHCEANAVFSWNKISKPRQFQPTDAGYDSCGGKWIHWGLLACFFPPPVFLQKMDQFWRWVQGWGTPLDTHLHLPCVCSNIWEQGSADSSEHPQLFPLSLCELLHRKTGSQQGLKRSKTSVRKEGGCRKPRCHSAAWAEGPDGVGREAFTGCWLGVKLAVKRRGSPQSCNIPSSPAIWLSTSWLTEGTSLWAQSVQHWIIRRKKISRAGHTMHYKEAQAKSC